MTVPAKNIPDPKSCRDAHHVLSVTIPTCPGFHTRLSILRAFSHDPTTFATDPRIIGSNTGSAPVELTHYAKIYGLLQLIIICTLT